MDLRCVIFAAVAGSLTMDYGYYKKCLQRALLVGIINCYCSYAVFMPLFLTVLALQPGYCYTDAAALEKSVAARLVAGALAISMLHARTANSSVRG